MYLCYGQAAIANAFGAERASRGGSGEEKTSKSMAVEKSAFLPDAGGAISAAPTVQSGGKPMGVAKDCPPDSKAK